MFYRIVGAWVAVLALSGAASAQMTPVSGSRGISMSATNGAAYANSASFQVPVFNDTHSISVAQATIESSLTPTHWEISGSALAAGLGNGTASASSSTYLEFEVAAGTTLHVTYWSQGSYGGFNSSVRVQGAGLNIFANGGQNGMGGSRTVFVTELSTVTLSAWGGGTNSNYAPPVHGTYSVTITASTAPGPGTGAALCAGACSLLVRRRRGADLRRSASGCDRFRVLS